MLTRWGTILARVAGTVLCSLPHLKLYFLKISSKMQRMGWEFLSRPPQGGQVGLVTLGEHSFLWTRGTRVLDSAEWLAAARGRSLSSGCVLPLEEPEL